MAGGSAMKRILTVCFLVVLVFLVVGCEDFYITETEPNDSLETANPIVASTVKGRISVAGDKDYWKMRVSSGHVYYFELSALEDDLQMGIYSFSLSNTSWEPSNNMGYLIDNKGTEVEEVEGITLHINSDAWLQFLVEGSGDNDGDEISNYKLTYSEVD